MTIREVFPYNDYGVQNVTFETPINPTQVTVVPSVKELVSGEYRQQTLRDYLESIGPKDQYNKPGQGVKFDAGKPRFDLIPFDLMDGEQRVWEFGAKKYAPNQWRNGMPMTQPFNALLRHLFAFMQGEDNDPESKECHLDHAVCCLRMMQNTLKNHPHLDDRQKKVS